MGCVMESIRSLPRPTGPPRRHRPHCRCWPFGGAVAIVPPRRRTRPPPARPQSPSQPPARPRRRSRRRSTQPQSQPQRAAECVPARNRHAAQGGGGTDPRRKIRRGAGEDPGGGCRPRSDARPRTWPSSACARSPRPAQGTSRPRPVRSRLVLAAGGLTPAERTKMIEVLAQLYFQAKDYPKAASWASRYVSEGGPNAEIRWLMIRSQYLAGDCASAARELRALVDADAKSGGGARAGAAADPDELLRQARRRRGLRLRAGEAPRQLSEEGVLGGRHSSRREQASASRITMRSTYCGCGTRRARSTDAAPTRR